MNSNERQKVCEWCLLPKFGENRCICDSPKFSMMEVCDGCEKWTDVDRLYPGESESVYCPDCSVTAELEHEKHSQLGQ